MKKAREYASLRKIYKKTYDTTDSHPNNNYLRKIATFFYKVTNISTKGVFNMWFNYFYTVLSTFFTQSKAYKGCMYRKKRCFNERLPLGVR